MKRVIILTTGGTISIKDLEGSRAKPHLGGEDLLKDIPETRNYAQIEAIEFDKIPGSYMTLERIVRLSKRAEELLEDGKTDGLVVTHGTDTLEETAYFLYLTVKSSKPVVFTGSMRTASQVGFDGPRNLLDAIRVVVLEGAFGLGPLVVFNEEIHSAGFVTKTNSQKQDTFQSPSCGPLGVVYGDKVVFFTKPAMKRPLLEKKIEPGVDLIKLAVGCDSKFIRYSIETEAQGIVIEAFGGGRVPPNILPAVKTAIEKGIAVVVATRCFTGELWDSYGYEGAFRTLEKMGAIFSHNLPGHKARLKLMLALGNFRDISQIRKYFEEE